MHLPYRLPFNYDAFGTLVGSTTATPYLYTGEQWDADVGAYYLRARWYLPEWGRFLGRDTYEGEVDDPISQNRFLYANANPVTSSDPTGLMTMSESMTYVQTQVRQYGSQVASVARGYKNAKKVMCTGGGWHLQPLPSCMVGIMSIQSLWPAKMHNA